MRAPVLITVLLLYILATPAAIQAGEARAVPEVGVLLPLQRPDYDEAKDPNKAVFMDGLQALGYFDGKNIHVELRAPRKPEDVAEMAADLVNRKVDVIATAGPESIDAARRATETIPIVIIACDRADRLVASIARPGGNITGMSCISSDLASKRLELLQEMVPEFSRLSVLFNGDISAKAEEFREIQARAQTMKIEVQSAEVRGPTGFTTAFAVIKAGNAQALLAVRDSDIIALDGNRRVCSGAASAVDVRVQRVLRRGRTAVLWHEPQASSSPVRIFHRQDSQRRQTGRHSY